MLAIVLVVSLHLGTPAAQAPPPHTPTDACPMVIGVRPDGRFVTYRFSGWRITSPRTLEGDLKGGCYNDNNPSKATTVTVEVSKSTPAGRLKLLYDLLPRNGWPLERVLTR